MNEKPLISVIIPIYRDWDRLKVCLEAIYQQEFTNEKVELLLVNNDPESQVPLNFNLSENVKVFNQPKPGSYASRNLGIAHSNGEILVFTDSDCIPDKSWLANGLTYLENGADLVGGRMEFFREGDGEELAYLFEKQFSFNQKRNVEQNKQSITANLFVKKKIFEAIGDFSENLLSGGDYEWTKRATSAGFRLVYGENVLVSHPARKTVESLKQKKRRTSGGMFFKFFNRFPWSKKISYSLFLLRPPVTIFGLRNLSLGNRFRLFWLRWHLEMIGVIELFLLQFSEKKAERT